MTGETMTSGVETDGAVKCGMAAMAAMADSDSPRDLDALCAKTNRKRRISVSDAKVAGISGNVGQINQAPSTSTEKASNNQASAMVVLGPLPSFRGTRPSKGSGGGEPSKSQLGNPGEATRFSSLVDFSEGSGGKYQGKVSVRLAGDPSILHAAGIPARLDQVPDEYYKGVGKNYSESTALHRPRKLSRGLMPESEADDVFQKKQGLIEKLTKSYGTPDDDDVMEDDDEGDVSGEDVFSEDDDDMQGEAKMSAMREVPSLFVTPFHGRDSPPQDGEAWTRTVAGAERMNKSLNGGAGKNERKLFLKSPSHTNTVSRAGRHTSFSKERESASWSSASVGNGRNQPSISHQSPNESPSRYCPVDSSASMTDDWSRQGRTSNCNTNGSSSLKNSTHPEPESFQGVFDRIHSRMSHNHYEKEGGLQKLPTSYLRESSSHSHSARRGTSALSRDGDGESSIAKSIGSKKQNPRDIFAMIEVQMSSRHSGKSPATASASHRHISSRNPDFGDSSLSKKQGAAAFGSKFIDKARRSPDFSEPRGGKLQFPESYTSQVARSRSANESHTSQVARSRNANGFAATPDSDDHSDTFIVNMKAVSSQKSDQDDRSFGGKLKPKNGLALGSFPRRATNGRKQGNIRGPSRDVIASIEADMMRLQEAEDEEEQANIRAMDMDIRGSRNSRTRVPIPYDHSTIPEPGHGNRQLGGLDQRHALDLMMMQQQQQHGQRVEGAVALSDQISNMAIDPLHVDADTSSCDKSIHSCISYDGKSTNVVASRVTTHAQELACHALNDAICDLYGAPVKTILTQYPMVTRLIRADDEMGNIQLHYAVRNGNVKAIRRIVRADPGCALIRNIQGYCPLHFAVQLGNFAAVQLLCCMVPASAEVQCEEGCLPLHEAVSTAAHLPDAPQIVAALINAFPSAIKITNDEGLLPLHLAAMSGFSAGIRTIFAYGFSTIYARENTEEMLPLDFAIDGYRTAAEEDNETLQDRRHPDEHRNEEEVEYRQCIDIFLMSALYDRPVFTSSRSDQQGMAFLPIHGATALQPCSLSWKQIISMYGKECASDVDVRGRTALHVLVTSKLYRLEVVTEMIKDIDELDPTSATTFDDSGLTPLHAALIHLAPYHVIECLLQCNWGTISMEVDEDCDNEEFHGMLPFQLAAACGCSVDVVNLLLRANPMGVAGALLKERRGRNQS